MVTGASAIAQQSESGQPARPFLLVEGWFDREWVSDLYTFTMDGRLIKRLTSEPLPTNHLVTVASGLGDPYFVANASALYSLSLRHNLLMPVHAANVGVVAVAPDGRTAAFVIAADAPPGTPYVAPQRARASVSAGPPLVLRVTPVIAGSPWRPVQFTLPPQVIPTEMTFTPDGGHVLITHWPGEHTAQLLMVDLKNGASQTVLAGDDVSYYQPVFAPDGKSLLAVREDFRAGRWSIISLPWPVAGSPAVIVTSPRGVSLSKPAFLADGTRFLFQQEETLVRATLDGKSVDPLTGTLDLKDHEWLPGLVDRRRPTRAGWMPGVVIRYIARLEWRERSNHEDPALADLIVIDVQTGRRTTVPMPSGKLLAAVVVEQGDPR